MRSRVRKDHVRKHGQDSAQRLLLSARDPENWLPLVAQTEYLGLIVSYGSFELQSLRHRVAKANGRRWAMASILHSKILSVGYKLQFWRSCILSIMTYGLHCCGVTGDGAQEAQRAQMRHIRAIVNNQAHLTGDTHAQIIARLWICFELLLTAKPKQRPYNRTGCGTKNGTHICDNNWTSGRRARIKLMKMLSGRARNVMPLLFQQRH